MAYLFFVSFILIVWSNSLAQKVDGCESYTPPFYGTFAPACSTMTKICIQGVVSGVVQPVTTYYSTDGKIQYSNYGGFELKSTNPFKGVALTGIHAITCEAGKDISDMAFYFILFPDSIPVKSGDAVSIEQYQTTWRQMMGGVYEYWVDIVSGTFVVDGKTYTPTATIQPHSSPSSQLSIFRGLDGLRITNLGRQTHIARLIDVSGRTQESLHLAPGETRWVNASLTTQVVGISE